MKYVSLGCRVLIALPFIGGCIFFFVSHSTNVKKQNQTHRFIPVQATVAESRVQRIRAKKGYRYKPLIRYSYLVNGISYESKRLGFAGARPEVPEYDGTPASYVAAFPVGATVQAFYNPNDPAEVVLTTRSVTGTTMRIFITMLGSFFMLLIFGPWVYRHCLKRGS